MRSKLLTLIVMTSLIWFPALMAAEDNSKELDQELSEARKELAEAARKVAELSRQIGRDEEVYVIRDQLVDRLVDTRVIVDRPMLGITMSPESMTDGKSKGVIVDAVSPRGPADEAGIRAGDVLVSIDEHSLAGDGKNSPASKLRDYMQKVEIGDELEVAYERKGKNGKASITADSFSPRSFSWSFDIDGLETMVIPGIPVPPMSPRAPRAPRAPSAMFFEFSQRWGSLELVSVTPDLGKYFGTDKGLLVVRAPKDEALQIKEGDVIIQIGDREPSSPGHAMRILRSYERGESVEVVVIRDKKRRTLNLEIPDRQTSDRWESSSERPEQQSHPRAAPN